MQTTLEQLTVPIIGRISTPFKEKFAIPRQPGLVPSATGTIELTAEFSSPDACRGLENFSHIWLFFQFHQIPQGKWSALVRPPRLGGNQKMGVFATRSTHRPSNIGMSVVKLDSIESHQGKTFIEVSGVDLLDGTPIIDIKPYIQYVDAVQDANSSFAQSEPTKLPVMFSDAAKQQLQAHSIEYAHLNDLIIETLQFDPSPAYHARTQPSNRVYGVELAEFNVRWQRLDAGIKVIEISKA